MDVKLENLIEKIKKEGVEEAQQASEEIIQNAKREAASILEKARKDAERIGEDGKRQSQRFKENAEADIKQAARNTELLLKEKIDALFDSVFRRKVGEAFSPEFLRQVILKLVEKWSSDNGAEVILNEEDKKHLEAMLFAGVQEEAGKAITLRVSPDLSGGFRIGMKNGDVYYDFSDETIAEVLKSQLNPTLKEVLGR